jgi:HSP20 family protein
MTNLVPRSSLFQDLFDFRRDFDQMFNRMLSGWPSTEGQGAEPRAGFAPSIEAYVDKSTRTYHCRISLPGVDPKDVQIHAQGNTLSIAGERKATHNTSDVDFLQTEIWYGAFERVLTLPEGVEADKVNAEYRNGVLEIIAPVAASVLPRRIEIKTTPAARQMTAA